MEDYSAVYKGKRLLITGGLGFIGSNLAHKLAEVEGAHVLLVDNLLEDSGGNLYNIEGIKDKVEVHIVDATDTTAMNNLVKKVDYIFNLLGHISHIDSMNKPMRDLESNAQAHLSLLEACRYHNPTVKIIHTSTRQIYGRPQYLPLDEEHMLNPVDINGVNTLGGEGYHRIYNDVLGVRSVLLRLTNTYGPRQLVKHARQGFIGWFIRQAVDGEEIKIYGDGKQLRDLNYVDDVIDALLRAGASNEAWGQIFNLGDAHPISLLEIAKVLVEITGKGGYTLVPFPPDKKSIDIGSCYSSFRKIKKALGWQPRVPLYEGLRRTVKFYQENRKYYWE